MTQVNRNLHSTPSIAGVGAMFQAYRREVKTVAGYISQAVALLDHLYADQNQTVDQLKAALARNHSLRHADFDAIFAVVLARREQARAPLARLVQDYCAGREAVLRELQDLFKCHMSRALEVWPNLKARLMEEQQDGSRQAVAALRRIHVEQEELSTALAGLLRRGEKLKIDDVRTVANRLADKDSPRCAELADLLAICETTARQADAKWQKLAG